MPSAPVLQAPAQATMTVGADPSQAMRQPWEVGPQNMYDAGQAIGATNTTLPPPPARGPGDCSTWKSQRAALLREWGQRREAQMHRFPRCLMDQMVSGSGLL